MQNQFRYKFLKWNVGYFEKIFMDIIVPVFIQLDQHICIAAFDFVVLYENLEANDLLHVFIEGKRIHNR